MIPWRKAWQPTPVFLPIEPHRQKNLEVYIPWGCKELDMTEQLNAHKFTQVAIHIFHHFLGLFDSQDEPDLLKLKINSIFFFFFPFHMFAEHLLWANYCFRYQRYNGIQQTDIPAITQPPVYWADIDNKPTRQ